MAINPDELYALKGSQVTDLADRIKDNEVAFKSFPNSVVTDGTTQEFMDSILALRPKIGSAYLGTVELSDLPAGLLQEEVMVYVYNDYVLYCETRSTDVAPYAWWCASYNYQGWQPVNTDTTYVAGTGLALSGATFSVNTSVIQEKLSTSQMNAVNSGIDSTKVEQITTNASDIDTIEGKIPSAASSSNQLADKNFVNSSIASNTATFRGSYNLVSDLNLTTSATEGQIATALASTISTAQNNDYSFVQIPVSDVDPTTIFRVDRYKYNGTAWEFEYSLNNSSFTASQWAAINSGITSGNVSKLAGIAAGAEVNVQSNWNETDADSDAYIQNKPTIPTVNDATLTITQNGTSAGTFTANASTDATIALTDTTYSAFIGTDGTSAGTAGLVPAPATTDAGKVLSASGSWTTPDAGIKTLTTADYNYPTDNPTEVALWKLDNGLYEVPSGLKYRYVSTSGPYTAGDSTTWCIHKRSSIAYIVKISGWPLALGVQASSGVDSNTTTSDSYEILTTSASLHNSLNVVAAGRRALDAYQGYVLDQKIEGRVKTNAGAPTTSTTGSLGQLLLDTTNAKLYQLTAINTSVSPNTYTWTEVGGSSGPTVVQTTGTSTTDVMSQNAVTSGLANKADSSSLATVATTGAYSDLSGTPTIPTVNDSTISLTNNGSALDSFTVNASSNKTIALNYPTITMTTTDPGEGQPLAANSFIAVYSAS